MLWHCWLGSRKGVRPVKMGGWWRWALVSPDGVAPSRMVCVSASVNLPLHHKVQKFSSGTGSSGWSRKKGRTTVVCVCVLSLIRHLITTLSFCLLCLFCSYTRLAGYLWREALEITAAGWSQAGALPDTWATLSFKRTSSWLKLIELRLYVPLDIKWVNSGMFFLANLLA